MQKDSFYNAKGVLLFLANNRRGVSKVKMARRRLSVGGGSFDTPSYVLIGLSARIIEF